MSNDYVARLAMELQINSIQFENDIFVSLTKLENLFQNLPHISNDKTVKVITDYLLQVCKMTRQVHLEEEQS